MHTRTFIIRTRIIGLFGVVAAGTPAQALTVGCWGDCCSGRDPEETGCSADGVAVASGPMWGTFNPYVELRWSPAGRTKWARLPAVWARASRRRSWPTSARPATSKSASRPPTRRGRGVA
ncbi:DUF2690 domain-containing protein [Micromonospora sp. NPDC005173]|uniref:DUF2690 domain-containing protein n=1 Tax=Micromonospora sp. NPDC005173 TaxID=3157165 RepID=UPI0033BD8F3B